jgi:Common central domain of tyrosinase
MAMMVCHRLRRIESPNNGSATLDPNSTNVDDALNEPDFRTYENLIQDGVHGYVHCTVGPTCPVAHMGDVPVAGNDAVFYHHHANIDPSAISHSFEIQRLSPETLK